MKRINFENGKTKANAATMDELQDNIEEAIDENKYTAATQTKDGLMSKEDKIILDSIGLGRADLPRLSNQDINSINLNGFCYLNGCNCGGTTLNNGYLLQLYYISTYKVQFFITAGSSGGLQYRKLVGGTWTAWANV